MGSLRPVTEPTTQDASVSLPSATMPSSGEASGAFPKHQQCRQQLLWGQPAGATETSEATSSSKETSSTIPAAASTTIFQPPTSSVLQPTVFPAPEQFPAPASKTELQLPTILQLSVLLQPPTSLL